MMGHELSDIRKQILFVPRFNQNEPWHRRPVPTAPQRDAVSLQYRVMPLPFSGKEEMA